jgi:SHS2 domain-containing protein
VARFKVIDHTADVGIIAYGKDLKEAFANAAYGMFSQIADLRGVKERWNERSPFSHQTGRRCWWTG